jgi:hypothetical protein
VTSLLKERFSPTHDLTEIVPEAPSLENFTLSREDLADDVALAMMDEKRVADCGWLYMKTR